MAYGRLHVLGGVVSTVAVVGGVGVRESTDRGIVENRQSANARNDELAGVGRWLVVYGAGRIVLSASGRRGERAGSEPGLSNSHRRR